MRRVWEHGTEDNVLKFESKGCPVFAILLMKMKHLKKTFSCWFSADSFDSGLCSSRARGPWGLTFVLG